MGYFVEKCKSKGDFGKEATARRNRRKKEQKNPSALDFTTYAARSGTVSSDDTEYIFSAKIA